MSASCQRWIDGLPFSSLFWPPPQDEQQRKAQILTYVEYFAQFTLEQFPDDIAQLIHSHYPFKETRLLDDVLAIFVLHRPEHGHAILHPLLSCIIDGSLAYNKDFPPFSSFVSLISETDEEFSAQWALACGEVLQVLTHYNRPIYRSRHQNVEATRSSSNEDASTSKCRDGEACHEIQENEQKPWRPLTPWITDILLSAPSVIRSDYFRWCGGVMGKYAAVGELKPPTTVVCGRHPGKHPQLVPSNHRWAIANGAGVILSVCDEEVARYDTANLTAAAVPAILLPPPTTLLDEHVVAGLPAIEPYACLFHRYYAIATPSATQRLLLELLEAPPSWVPDALDAVVQLMELLRAAEDHASCKRAWDYKLPQNWIQLHFLRAIGIAMSMRTGIAADAAAALLFRILSQPALLFPPLRHAEGAEVQPEPLDGYISYKQQLEIPAAEAAIEATAQGVASMLCAYGPDVEWRICTIWEAAYGLLPLRSSGIDLPEIAVATPIQRPTLSWNLYLPLLKVLEYVPQGSPSEACLMRIFVATVEAILRRAFPQARSFMHSIKSSNHVGEWLCKKNLAVAELQAMIHCLFLESHASMDLASRLLLVVFTVCISHEALANGNKRLTRSLTLSSRDVAENSKMLHDKSSRGSRNRRNQGPAGTFDSYVLAAICGLSYELQLFPLISKSVVLSDSKDPVRLAKVAKTNFSQQTHNGMCSAVRHTRRILGILESLLSLKPSFVGTYCRYCSNETVAAAMVAAHISELFGRSKACLNALSVLMGCKRDTELSASASSLYHLIDLHGKAVASIVDKAQSLMSRLAIAPPKRDILLCTSSEQLLSPSNSSSLELEFMQLKESSLAPARSEKAKISDAFVGTSEKYMENLSSDTSDLSNFLTVDCDGVHNCRPRALLKSVIAENQELCFSVVCLLWQKLIAAPDAHMSAESTSAQQGWRQVNDALCDVVSASPTKASTAIIVQAERDLQPWIARDDDRSQTIWRINRRILKLIVEIMRNQRNAETLVILASTSDLLLRATDGMLVDREACILPQLELLEGIVRSIRVVAGWGDAGIAVADELANMIKRRLSAMVRCLSHPSAHVRALSLAVLRDLTSTGPIEVEECIKLEARCRKANGLTPTYLISAAKELGCALPD